MRAKKLKTFFVFVILFPPKPKEIFLCNQRPRSRDVCLCSREMILSRFFTVFFHAKPVHGTSTIRSGIVGKDLTIIDFEG